MARSNPIKGPLLFLGVAAAILLLTIFVLAPKQEEKKQAESNASLLWGGLKREDILSLEFKNPKGEFKLKKDSQGENSWILSSGENNFEADSDAVIGLISTLIAAKHEENLKAPPLDQVGLAQPSYQVKVETVNGDIKKSELLIGNDTPVNYFVYAKWANSQDVFLTTRSLRFGIDKDAKDLRNKTPIEWPLSDLKQLSYQSFGKNNFPVQQFDLKNNNGQWESDGKIKSKINFEDLQKWYTPIHTVKAHDFASDTKEQKSKLGFTRPSVKITLVHKNGQKQVWSLATKDKTVGKTKVTELYFSENDLNTTYLMKNNFLDALKLELFQIRNKKVTSFDSKKITKMVVKGRTKTMTFIKAGATWDATSNFKGFEQGEGMGPTIDRINKVFSALEATKYHDSASKWKTMLSQPSRTLEFYIGDKLVETVKVGKILSGSEVIVQSSSNSSPSSVLVNIEEIVPLKPEPYIIREALKKPATNPATTNKEKNKMEATVSSTSELKKLPSAIVKPGHTYTAEITVAGKGLIEITFDSEKAPYTVSNFLHLARNNFYNGVKFHRVIPDFVVQGGDPDGNGTGGPGWIFDYESNDLKHEIGTISMAHASDPNTNGSQFFLVLKPQPHLNGVHTVFGRITKGLDVMNAIKQGDSMEKVEVFEKAK